MKKGKKDDNEKYLPASVRLNFRASDFRRLHIASFAFQGGKSGFILDAVLKQLDLYDDVTGELKK